MGGDFSPILENFHFAEHFMARFCKILHFYAQIYIILQETILQNIFNKMLLEIWLEKIFVKLLLAKFFDFFAILQI